MRAITLTTAALLVITGCSGGGVVNTGEWATFPTSVAPTAPVLPPIDTPHMANAFDYAISENDRAAYFFTTPSGRWHCAILPRDKAGCQVTGGGALSVAGAPDTVADAEGEEVPPNAIVVEPDGEAHFAALDAPGFTAPDTAKVLPFNKTLIAALFRCNVQEATGVACLSEQSGKGFTFSADGFTPQYSEVPLDAP
ncbi:hypothetical protein [Mycolicibacterium sp. 120270]|uniref:hypothetical protein n=1 Tax=Mycolicibacterium sp. 120270 TaxID=3090600 RepID=UPI00299DD601|nr:hypothetical protein [Mycolicibacterium sp. 120270]MDX1883703.1 hypothetical protein [Mycolicibacterium sp. 120270]